MKKIKEKIEETEKGREERTKKDIHKKLKKRKK